MSSEILLLLTCYTNSITLHCKMWYIHGIFIFDTDKIFTSLSSLWLKFRKLSNTIKHYEVKCIEAFLIIIVPTIAENVCIMYMKLLKKINLYIFADDPHAQMWFNWQHCKFVTIKKRNDMCNFKHFVESLVSFGIKFCFST